MRPSESQLTMSEEAAEETYRETTKRIEVLLPIDIHPQVNIALHPASPQNLNSKNQQKEYMFQIPVAKLSHFSGIIGRWILTCRDSQKFLHIGSWASNPNHAPKKSSSWSRTQLKLSNSLSRCLSAYRSILLSLGFGVGSRL
jgi:hypothetical protein